MEPLRRPALLIMFLAAVLLPLRSSASQQAETRKPSNTWQMRCVLKVSVDAEILPLSFDPELGRVEQTARRCEQIDARICDLKTHIENLQPCTIAVLGGTE